MKPDQSMIGVNFVRNLLKLRTQKPELFAEVALSYIALLHGRIACALIKMQSDRRWVANAIESAFMIRPDVIPALSARAWLAAEDKRWEEELRDRRKLLELDPEDQEMHMDLLWLLLKMEKTEEARALCEKFGTNFRMVFANFFIERRRLDEAIAFCDEQLATDPTSPIRSRRALALLQLGRDDEAFREADHIITETAPEDAPVCRFIRGTILARRGQTKEAEEDLTVTRRYPEVLQWLEQLLP